MKIGILGSRGIPNQYGGFEQFAEYLAQGLAEKGAEIWVYCSSGHPYRNNNWKGIHLIHCTDPEDKMGTAGQFIYDFNCIRDSRKRGFDIIYQLGYTSSSVWHRLLPRTSIVVTNMDGLEWKRSKYNPSTQKFLKFAEKLAALKSDFLVADSEAIQQHLKLVYGRDSFFLPYGAEIFEHPNEKKLVEFGLQPYSYYLMIARLQPDNHIEEIIRGVLNSGTNMPLLVIGQSENKYGKYLTQKYRDDRIKFIGGIFDGDILNQLRYFSKLYFHGHSAGGTNPSLLEAMASSALICAHNNPFNREVLGENAFFFDDDKSVADLLISKKMDAATRKSFVSNNIKTIKVKYNWPKIIHAYFELFVRLTKTRVINS